MELVDSGLRILGLTLSLKPEALNPDPITLNPKPYNPKSLRFWGFCDFFKPSDGRSRADSADVRLRVQGFRV